MSGKKIIKPVKKWKFFVSIAVAIAVVYVIMLCYSTMINSMVDSSQPQNYSDKEIENIVTDRDVSKSPEDNPRIALEVPDNEYIKAEKFYKKNPAASKKQIKEAVKKGTVPAWYPKGEAPVLQELVKKGKLPPVAERTGPEPIVEHGADGIGKYGGTWLRAATSELDVSILRWRLAHSRLLRHSPMGDPVVPHLAKSFEMKDGGRIWEVKLRKAKWSDGHPVTSDDIMFWWMVETDKLIGDGLPPRYMMIGGKYGHVKKIDDHTVQFIFPFPYGSFKYVLAKNEFLIRPYHYLKKYHPATGDPDFIESEMKAYQLSSPRLLYEQQSKYLNPECPVLNPWIIRKDTTKPPYVFVRNPYYYAVDEAGNQLPYIDRVQFDIVEGKMMPVAATTGKMSMQARHIHFNNYTDLMSKTKNANLKLYHWLNGDSSQWLISPNINKPITAKEPQSKWKTELLADKHFRQALSLAINRDKINEAVFYGLGTPSQIEPGPFSPFHSKKLANAYIQYNPEEANKLLDEIYKSHNLDPNKRVNGYRCTPDGKLLTFYLTVSDSSIIDPAQFVVDDWAKVGIRCTYSYVGRVLFEKEKWARDFDFNIWTSNAEILPLYSARYFIAYSNESNFALGWAAWYEKGGLYGMPESKYQGCIPVPENSPMYKAMQNYEKARQAASFAEQKKYLDKVFDIAAENIWCINLVSNLPQLVVASADMKNIPVKAYYTNVMDSPGNAGIDTYYFEHPDNSAYNENLALLENPGEIKRYDGKSSKVSTAQPVQETSNVISWLFTIIILLLLALLCFKHPFVLRRLFIMIPTLFIVSILVFTVIQLPPGNFLTLRIAELRATGKTESEIDLQIKELESYFHFNEPAWKRYCRWMGFYWFKTYNKLDKGLLQGDMGRSMDTLKPVGDIVGDRILLTFLISLGTILFTWLLAIPIGIYSACRQYSMGDYFFTFLGFVGMSIPAFLLALIFSALTGLSGLFSANFMAQPYWDWPKFFDLLKHIWIPIVIMGTGGTASMIRIMRANLLDELKKPYVTTAKAKGVRPIKLLFKYPVRIAINPFISGIGALFPTLVSGTTIVAIVLSLPTIGPLQYSAILNQDMYMAGSLLMVLSLLAIIGTLVSDLLLLALDPRIRFTGGSK